ncbi:MAG: hypothetical protein V1685_03955 [Parcubacteria group bacterium]
MSRKFFSNLTAPERLMTVTVVALTVVALLAFAVSQKDGLLSISSPEEVNVPLSFDTPQNITSRVIEVNPNARIISVDTDIEDIAQAGTFVTKRLSVQVNDDTQLKKFEIAKLHLNTPSQTLSLSELEPGTAIVVSSKDNPQTVSTVHALAVSQYIR